MVVLKLSEMTAYPWDLVDEGLDAAGVLVRLCTVCTLSWWTPSPESLVVESRTKVPSFLGVCVQSCSTTKDLKILILYIVYQKTWITSFNTCVRQQDIHFKLTILTQKFKNER